MKEGSFVLYKSYLTLIVEQIDGKEIHCTDQDGESYCIHVDELELLSV